MRSRNLNPIQKHIQDFKKAKRIKKEHWCLKAQSGTNSSIKAGIDTSVIWDGDIEKRYFSEKVLDFTTDFTSYPGNLDQTHEEYIATSVKKLLKKSSSNKVHRSFL